MGQSNTWHGRTGGGKLGQKFLFWLLRIVNVSFIYPILFLVIPFYLIFSRKGYKAIFSFFRHNIGKNRWSAFWSTCKNHYLFGEIVLDKFALLAGNSGQFKVEINGMEHFYRVSEKEQGVIIVSAHVGNFELAGHCLQQSKKQINGLIFGGETESFQKQRELAFSRSKINLIETKEDMSHIFAIKEKIEKGEVLTVLCDRSTGNRKRYNSIFLGRQATFPIGIFKLAVQFETPVLAVFIMKQKGVKYQGYIIPLESKNAGASQKERIEHLTQQYIHELEKIVKKYPEQWFNYYNFWNI